MAERLLRIPEVAQLLAVHRSTMYRLIGDGALRVVQLSRGGRRVPMSALDAYVRGLQKGIAA